jgi:manganese transport protein
MSAHPPTATADPTRHRADAIPADLPLWKQLLRIAGPGMLVAVGYMDPGNWATDIEAGSKFGYSLLFVVLLSSVAAMVLQCFTARMGIATGKDLAQLTREHYSPGASRIQWVLAELSITCCDLAEVLGSALAFKLLLGVPLAWGVALTAFDTLIILGLKNRGMGRIEAIVLGLVMTVALCFLVEMVLVQPNWADVAAGFVPRWQALSSREPLYLAIGILGATIMPHNLYLQSAMVQNRVIAPEHDARLNAIRLTRVDTIGSLTVAMLINAAILILAGAAFHHHGQRGVSDIGDAYRLLAPIAGTTAAAVIFGIGLLASGQSSTFTGTLAGQVILEGFLGIRMPDWQRRLVTRALALVPAFIGVMILGDNAIGTLLVASQVVLSAQLPFAMYPLIRFTSNAALMGRFANPRWLAIIGWTLFAIISAANAWLVVQLTTGS